jgi:ribosomal protein S18 acetylase RimI-like enzyme
MRTDSSSIHAGITTFYPGVHLGTSGRVVGERVVPPGRAGNNRRMPAAHIRPATLADTAGIGLAHARSWRSAYRGKMPQDHLDGLDPAVRAKTWRRIMAETEPSRGGVLAAVAEGGGITGFASFGPSRDRDADPRRTGEVFAIYVDPDAWGTGTGRQLMAGAVAELARLGYTEATLWVLDTNDRARRFYALGGWAEDGASKTDGSRGFDITEVRYRKMLSRCA